MWHACWGATQARGVAEGIIAAVSLMKDSGLPCFGRGRPVENLRKRFHLDLSDAQAAAFMRATIADAYDKVRLPFRVRTLKPCQLVRHGFANHTRVHVSSSGFCSCYLLPAAGKVGFSATCCRQQAKNALHGLLAFMDRSASALQIAGTLVCQPDKNQWTCFWSCASSSAVQNLSRAGKTHTYEEDLNSYTLFHMCSKKP